MTFVRPPRNAVGERNSTVRKKCNVGAGLNNRCLSAPLMCEKGEPPLAYRGAGDDRARMTQAMSAKPRPAMLSRWLWIVALLVIAVVAVGGITRLTESGLSIT